MNEYGITPATQKIFNLNKRIRAVAGGTAAGKTIGILEVLIDAAILDITPTITSIVSESFSHLRRGAMRDFESILKALNRFNDNRWNKTNSTYTFKSGSKIEFFSADQSGKAHGPRRDRLFINEANNIPYETFDQLVIRTSQYIFIDWNPASEFWFYSEVKDRPDCDFITLTYKDNTGINEEIIKEIELHKGNARWWKVYGEGQLGDMVDRIYTGWKIIKEVPHEARLVKYGLDFGYTHDPTALIALYYFNGGYIVDEILYQKGLSNKQIADVLKALPAAVVIADSAEPKSIDEIRMYGISVIPTTKGKGSVKQRINYTQAQRVSVTENSVNVIKEYRNYMWTIDKQGKMLNYPEHTWSHSMDAVSYSIQSMRPREPHKVWEQPAYESPSISAPERRVLYRTNVINRGEYES